MNTQATIVARMLKGEVRSVDMPHAVRLLACANILFKASQMRDAGTITDAEFNDLQTAFHAELSATP